jgi:hypothetical protein
MLRCGIRAKCQPTTPVTAAGSCYPALAARGPRQSFRHLYRGTAHQAPGHPRQDVSVYGQPPSSGFHPAGGRPNGVEEHSGENRVNYGARSGRWPRTTTDGSSGVPWRVDTQASLPVARRSRMRRLSDSRSSTPRSADETRGTPRGSTRRKGNPRRRPRPGRAAYAGRSWNHRKDSSHGSGRTRPMIQAVTQA